MICTSCRKLGEFTSLIQLCLRTWSQHPSPAQSYLQKVSHSHGTGGACRLAAMGPRCFTAHRSRGHWLPPCMDKPQTPRGSSHSLQWSPPWKLVFALLASKFWTVFQLLMHCITTWCVSDVVLVSPSALHLAKRSASSYHVLGHWAPCRKGLRLCTTSETGPVVRAYSQVVET